LKQPISKSLIHDWCNRCWKTSNAVSTQYTLNRLKRSQTILLTQDAR